MARGTAVHVVLPERVGYQLWAESTSKRELLQRGLDMRFVLVAATIACGLVAGVVISRLFG